MGGEVRKNAASAAVTVIGVFTLRFALETPGLLADYTPYIPFGSLIAWGILALVQLGYALWCGVFLVAGHLLGRWLYGSGWAVPPKVGA